MASRSVTTKKRNAQSGFTLMELLVTLAVTVFGLMGMMALHTSMSGGADVAGRTQEAVSVGTQVLESLRSARPADMMQTLTGSPASEPPQNIEPFTTILGRNAISYTVDVHVTAVTGASNLWKIRVEVKWTDDNSTVEHSIPFEVLRTSRDAL